ncbi:MAG: hypothetical protein QM755_12430 [Luteolibacter sp.]
MAAVTDPSSENPIPPVDGNRGKIGTIPPPPSKCRISSLFHRMIWLTGLLLTGGGVALAQSTSGWGAIYVAIYLGAKVAGAFLVTALAAYFVVRKKVPASEREFLFMSAICSPVLSWFLVAGFTFLFRPLSDC